MSFHIACDTEASAIHFEYYLDGTPAGGGAIGKADGSRLAAEDVLTKDFIPDDILITGSCESGFSATQTF